tara:strand:+ start:369 stop:1562 length:1194 start_codon:yes stop_codon:yes gene_type:complete
MKKLLLILLYLPMIVFGQGWIQEYDLPSDPGDGNIVSNVEQTNDGGYMIFSSGWLVKTNSTGDTLWSRIGVIGGGMYNDGFQTADNGYIRFLSDTILKYDEFGNILWGKPGYRNQKRGIQTTDNGCVSVGSDYSVYKTDSLGDSLWMKEIEGGSATSIDQTNDGGYITTGRYSYNLGSSSLCLIKFNSLGDSLWSKSFNFDSAYCKGSFVQQTTDGGYIISGRGGNNGCTQLVLLKTFVDGNIEWVKMYPDNGCIVDAPYGKYVQQTSDGGYIIMSNYYWNQSIDYGKMWLLKTDAQGDTLWTRKFGNSFGHGTAVRQTSDGGYILTGLFYQNSDSVNIALIKLDSQGTISSIIELNKNKKLIGIRNILGQRTPYRRNTPLFYIYDDGTVEKRIVVD